MNPTLNRRDFLGLAALAVSTPLARAAGEPSPHIATNVYPWTTFYGREGRNWNQELDAGLAEVAKTGIAGFEPIANSPEQLRALAPLLKKHGLEMRSLYINSSLHEAGEAEGSVAAALAIGEEAARQGVAIIVTNPSPLQWGGAENKTDAQLREQARNLDRLGAGLRGMGITLAYHNHDAELRAGGREFHHMLTATDPDNVRFCLDAHWVFRGCGDSQVALFDAVEHYASRIVELHLRQSLGGPWTEVFAASGDIDYRRLFDRLAVLGIKPHLVLEQAVESGSPNTMDALQAHRAGRRNLLDLVT